MPRVAKKTTEKLRKKVIRRKSLRQKKRTMKKKNNARRTRRNMRKRNKRGGAAAEEEEEEEEEEVDLWERAREYDANNDTNNDDSSDENNGQLLSKGPKRVTKQGTKRRPKRPKRIRPPYVSRSQPITANEIQSAMQRFTDSFPAGEERYLAGLMMKEHNKVIWISNPNGPSKEIDVLRSIKGKMLSDRATLDEQFNLYLCEKLNITIKELESKIQTIISTTHASSRANHMLAVRDAHEELKVRELKEILKIIKKKGGVASKQLEELKERLGYNDLELNDKEEIYAWAQFVAGCTMIASNTNSGSIMGVLTILFSNRKGIILEKVGPQKKPLKQIALELITSKTEELKYTAHLHMLRTYEYISASLRGDTQVAKVKEMADKMITVVGKFLNYIISLDPYIVNNVKAQFSLVNHYLGQVKSNNVGRKYYSAAEERTGFLNSSNNN